MKTSNLIIRIPEPCHEDWNKMQPDATGKFCGSCCKSVVDFSNKSDTEIRDILMEYKGQKVCGHFKKTQVDRPLNIRINFNDLPKNMSSTKTFAVALFLVFGTLLFSCTNEHNEKLGKIAVESNMITTKGEISAPPETVSVDSVARIDEVDGLLEYQYSVGGAISVEGDIYVEEVPMADSVIVPEEITKIGEVAVTREYFKGKVSVEKNDSTDLAGIDSSFTERTVKIGDQPVVCKNPSFNIYPNPGNGEFTIKYDVLKRSDVRVDVLNLNGALIRTVVNVPAQHEGKYNIAVNLTELPNGIYLVSLIKEGKRSTGKLIIEK
jgi:hypothetical protein